MTGMTLEDAIAVGQGVERPCRCPVHDDSQASASVNVIKGVWYCHACFASGTVDGKKTPSVDSLKAMMEPEKIARDVLRRVPGALHRRPGLDGPDLLGRAVAARR